MAAPKEIEGTMVQPYVQADSRINFMLPSRQFESRDWLDVARIWGGSVLAEMTIPRFR